jgi:hypothetical protein
MTLSPQKATYTTYQSNNLIKDIPKYTSYSQTPSQSVLNDSSSLIISQLKTKIFDLEQSNKNYDALQAKYK